MGNILIHNVNLQMQITPHTMRTSSSFILPDGWEIEEKPRKNTNTAYSDKVPISFLNFGGFSLLGW